MTFVTGWNLATQQTNLKGKSSKSSDHIEAPDSFEALLGAAMQPPPAPPSPVDEDQAALEALISKYDLTYLSVAEKANLTKAIVGQNLVEAFAATGHPFGAELKEKRAQLDALLAETDVDTITGAERAAFGTKLLNMGLIEVFAGTGHPLGVAYDERLVSFVRDPVKMADPEKTLMEIAKRYDIHNVTGAEAIACAKELYAAGLIGNEEAWQVLLAAFPPVPIQAGVEVSVEERLRGPFDLEAYFREVLENQHLASFRNQDDREAWTKAVHNMLDQLEILGELRKSLKVTSADS